MTDEPVEPGQDTAPKVTIMDPSPTLHFVDNIAYCGIVGSGVGVIFTTNVGRIDEHGKVKGHHLIAARLRLDLNMARALRDQLNTQIDLLSPPTGLKAN